MILNKKNNLFNNNKIIILVGTKHLKSKLKKLSLTYFKAFFNKGAQWACIAHLVFATQNVYISLYITR